MIPPQHRTDFFVARLVLALFCVSAGLWGQTTQPASPPTPDELRPAAASPTTLPPSSETTRELPPSVRHRINAVNQSPTDLTNDIRDPRAFVLIWETDFKRRILPLLTNSASTADAIAVSEVLDAEVDIRSRINIEFNEALIRAHAASFDANLTITAQLKSATTVRDIKVDGYSSVEEGTTQPAVRLRSASELLPVLRNLRTALQRRVKVSRGVTLTLGDVFRPSAAQPTQQDLEDLRDSLDTEDVVIRAALTKIVDPSNRPVLDALTRLLEKDSATLVAQARQGMAALDFVAADRANHKDSHYSAVKPLYVAMVNLIPLAEIEESTAIGYMLGALKSGGILVSQTGAQVGDQITLTIKNGSDTDPAGVRRKSFQYRVGRFGWNDSISDSALLIYRLGIGVGDNAAAVAAGKSAARATGQPVTVESPDRLNYSPAPGITRGLTLAVRRSDSFGGKVLRFLEPGVGVNVSFPQFSSTVTHITPAATGEPVVTVDTSKRPIDISVGPVVSLWDNAVQFTYGWNLNADSRRTYIGIGFGFVKVLEKIKSLKGS